MKAYRIKYRTRWQIDRYVCYDTFNEIIVYDIYIEQHLIYGKVNEFEIKTFQLEEIIEMEYLGIARKKFNYD